MALGMKRSIGFSHRITFQLVLILFVSTLAFADEEYSPRTKRAASVPPNTNLRVVSILSEPYTMLSDKTHADNYHGYRGFIPDLVREMERRMGLNITFYVVPDNRYGALQADQTWNGMIGEVLKKQNGDPNGADLAAADLTVTSLREAHVDYIKPFQHLGIVMVVKKPSAIEGADKSLWDFAFDVMGPLAPEVWAVCTIGVLLVGFLLWVNNRYNPNEWNERYRIGRGTEAAAESFSIVGSLWFTFSTLQWQGFERAPRSASSKVLSAFWFAFVTLTLLTYTGSLLNHLFWASTVHGKDPNQHQIRSLKDLVHDPSYDYGVVQGGSSMNYFMNIAEGPIYDKMEDFWATDRGIASMVRSTLEGFHRVRQSKNGKYVFLAEKTAAEYEASKEPCDIMTVGPPMAPRSYAMAVPHNMDKAISEALHSVTLEMFEEGDIAAIERKWWYDMGECSQAEDELASKQSALFVNKPKRVTLEMFWGPLVLLVVGIVLAIIVAIGETVYFRTKGRTEPYTMRPSANDLPGESHYGFTGFIPDLLDTLSKRLNITFTLEVRDSYGFLQIDNKTWNGMIGGLIKGEKGQAEGFDLAAAPMTVTAAREKVVDFLHPFQHDGLTLVVKKPLIEPEKEIWEYTFDLVKPLSGEVWTFACMALLAIAGLLWANNRINPYEWSERHNLGRAPEAASETFDMSGSFFYAFASLQWQGFERAPRSMAAKCLTMFWFVFITITLVTYTGSLVSHMFWASTVHGRDPTQPEIKDLHDLVRRTDYDYGYVQGGFTDNYFMNAAEGPIYDRMKRYWASGRGQTAMVKSVKEGMDRVRNSKDGKYVFIVEKNIAEWYISRPPCDVVTTGGVVGPRSYGMALRHKIDPKVKEALHQAVLEMTEEGDIAAMEFKWWHIMGSCWNVTLYEGMLRNQAAFTINKPKQVTLSMFWGPVVLLVVGVIVTILIAAAEIAFFKYKGRYQHANRPDPAFSVDDEGTIDD